MATPNVNDIRPYQRVGGVQIDTTPLLKAGMAIDQYNQEQEDTKHENIRTAQEVAQDIDLSGLYGEMSNVLAGDLEAAKQYTMDNLEALERGDLSAYNKLRGMVHEVTQKADQGRRSVERYMKQKEEYAANPEKYFDTSMMDDFETNWKNGTYDNNLESFTYMGTPEEYVESDMDYAKFNDTVRKLATTVNEKYKGMGLTEVIKSASPEDLAKIKEGFMQDPETLNYLTSIAQRNPERYQKDEQGNYPLSQIYDDELANIPEEVRTKGSYDDPNSKSSNRFRGYRTDDLLNRKYQINALMANNEASINQLLDVAKLPDLGVLKGIQTYDDGRRVFTFSRNYRGEPIEETITPSNDQELRTLYNNLLNSRSGADKLDYEIVDLFDEDKPFTGTVTQEVFSEPLSDEAIDEMFTESTFNFLRSSKKDKERVKAQDEVLNALKNNPNSTIKEWERDGSDPDSNITIHYTDGSEETYNPENKSDLQKIKDLIASGRATVSQQNVTTDWKSQTMRSEPVPKPPTNPTPNPNKGELD